MYSIDWQTKTVGFDSISYMFVYIVCIDRDKRFNAKPAIYLPLQPATMGFSPAGVQAHWSEPHHRMWAASRRWWWRAWSFGNSDSVNRIYETCINKYSKCSCCCFTYLHFFKNFRRSLYLMSLEGHEGVCCLRERQKKKETHINENKSKHSIIACAQIHKHGNIHTHTHTYTCIQNVCAYIHIHILYKYAYVQGARCVCHTMWENSRTRTIKLLKPFNIHAQSMCI